MFELNDYESMNLMNRSNKKIELNRYNANMNIATYGQAYLGIPLKGRMFAYFFCA